MTFASPGSLLLLALLFLSASRRTRSGMPTAYLMACQRIYSGALGCATRMLGVLALIRFGLSHGDSERKANGSTDHNPSR